MGNKPSGPSGSGSPVAGRSGPPHGSGSSSGHVQRLDGELRSKFKKGVQFTMKIVVRGARRSGKTALVQRLQGKRVPTSYQPSKELTTCTINWAYKSTSDVVKVRSESASNIHV